MAHYYFRFVKDEAQATSDLERGHSFHDYYLMPSVLDVLQDKGYEVDEDGEVFDYEGEWFASSIDDAADRLGLAQDNATGLWGFPTDGLCGFGEYDTVEEAIEAARDSWYAGGDVLAVFQGEPSMSSDPDGSLFYPKRLVLVTGRPR